VLQFEEIMMTRQRIKNHFPQHSLYTCNALHFHWI